MKYADPLEQATLRLAEIEAQLARVRQALDELSADFLRWLNHIEARRAEIDASTALLETGEPLDRDIARISRWQTWLEEREQTERQARLRRLTRYRAEAEAQRRKALRAWIAARAENSRNEANLA